MHVGIIKPYIVMCRSWVGLMSKLSVPTSDLSWAFRVPRCRAMWLIRSVYSFSENCLHTHLYTQLKKQCNIRTFHWMLIKTKHVI